MIEKVLNLIKSDPRTLECLCYHFYKEGNYDAALEVIDTLFGFEVKPKTLQLLGTIYLKKKDFQRAVSSYKKAIELDPKEGDFYIELSRILDSNGRSIEAIKILLEGFKQTTKKLPLALLLGNRLYTLKNYNGASYFYSVCLQEKPNSTQALCNLGVIKKEQKRFAEAEALYKKALSINPNDAAVYNNMGVLYKTLRRYKEGIKVLRKAIKIDPNAADAHSNLGAILKECNKPNWAQKYYKKALSINPSHINANLDYGIIKMLEGKYKEGLLHYEYRLLMPELKSKQIGLKVGCTCKKGEDVKGLKVLVYGEQGFGDNLQFVRYLNRLKEIGAFVIFRTRPELKRLIEGSNLANKIVLEGEEVEYDCHIALLSLPHFLDIDPLKEAYKQYIFINEPRKKSDTKLKIALCFSGSPTHKAHKERFIDPKLFNFLNDIEGVKIVNMQMGEDGELLKKCDFLEKVIDKRGEIKDFLDSAHILNECDLLITSDTSVAHLGGALGVPTWVLLPSNPDWRWGRKGSKTLWYDSVVLFRQKCKYRWEGVIDEVIEKLSNFCLIYPLNAKK